MKHWLTRWLRSPNLMSAAWLKERERLEPRIEYQGVTIVWPIKKVLNESSQWNRHQEAKRKRA